MIKKIIFIVALLSILLSTAGLCIAGYSSYEFINSGLRDVYYRVILFVLPVGIVFTLTGTVREKFSELLNGLIVISTFGMSAASFVYTALFVFRLSFADMSNEKVIYKSKNNPNVVIAERWLLYGAMGDDQKQIVYIEPFFVWQKVAVIDSAAIDKSEWQQHF